MIIQVVHFTFDASDVEKVVSILRELRGASKAEPGVVAFEVARDEQNQADFWLWEVYKDQAAFDSHKSSEHYNRLVVNGIRPLVKKRDSGILSPI